MADSATGVVVYCHHEGDYYYIRSGPTSYWAHSTMIFDETPLPVGTRVVFMPVNHPRGPLARYVRRLLACPECGAALHAAACGCGFMVAATP